MTKSIEIQKTHYELVEFFLNEMWGGLDDIYEKINSVVGSDPSFEQFRDYCNEYMREFFVSGAREADIQYYGNILFHLYMMNQQKKRVYWVMPALAAKLAGTSLQHIDTEFLISPFREIYLSIEPGLLQIEDVVNGTVDVSGIYIYFKKHKDGVVELRVMAAALLKPSPLFPFNDSVFYFKLFLKPGKIGSSVTDYVENQIEWNQRELKRFNGNINLEHLEHLTYFIVNVLLYMGSKDAEIVSHLPQDFAARRSALKSKSKIRKLEKKEARVTRIPVLLIGPSQFSDEALLNRIKRDGGLIRWRLDRRIKVSSHWRGQWYGSERDGTRRKGTILIDDYEKGTKETTVVAKTYKVGRR